MPKPGGKRGCPDFREGREETCPWGEGVEAQGTASAKALWQELGRFEDAREGMV